MEEKTLLRKIVLSVLIISTIGATILSILVFFNPLLTIDIAATKYIQAEGSNPLEKALILFFLKGISWFGIPTVAIWLVLLTAFFFWLTKYYRESIYCLASLLTPIINLVIKNLIHRPRPVDNYALILDYQASPSFPSGHVMLYTVFYGFLFTAMFYTKRIPKWLRIFIVIFSVIVIITISISRIYLGAHWLTDALGGYSFGLINLSILLYFYLKKVGSTE